jgi:hydrogenase maturation protease
MVTIDAPTGPVRVLGIGNVLMSDDGFGPTVARILAARYRTPAEVEIEDIGTPGADLVPYLCNAAAVIIVDTVKVDAPPGTIRIYRDRELVASPPPERTNPHQPGLREALMAAELSDQSPREVVLIGVTPGFTDQGTVLSDAVQGAVEQAVELVLTELDRLGRPLEPRLDGPAPDLWWR